MTAEATIALVLTRTLRSRLFSAEHLRRLNELGAVVVNDSNGNNRATVSDLLPAADVAITSWGSPRLTGEVIGSAPALRLVVHAAGSAKPIVSDRLWERGIRVSTAAAPLGRGVAETALGMTIASVKNLWRIARDTGAGGWTTERAGARELYGLTVGVIGAGHAGSHFIRLLQHFDVEVLVSDPRLTAEDAAAMGAARIVDTDELLRESDVVSIHAPSLPETRRMLDARALTLMKDRAILINTARGSIVDENALVEELRAGRLFACLDVTDPEPPAPDHPLRSLPNCVLTSHVAGLVTNGQRRIGQHVLNEVRRYLAGEPMAGEITHDRIMTMA